MTKLNELEVGDVFMWKTIRSSNKIWEVREIMGNGQINCRSTYGDTDVLPFQGVNLVRPLIEPILEEAT